MCRTTRKSEVGCLGVNHGAGMQVRASWGCISPYTVKPAITETNFYLSRIVKSNERLKFKFKLHTDTTPPYNPCNPFTEYISYDTHVL